MKLDKWDIYFVVGCVKGERYSSIRLGKECNNGFWHHIYVKDIYAWVILFYTPLSSFKTHC